MIPGGQELPPLAELQRLAVPFRVRLVMPFRGVEHRDGLLLQGPAGWGEWAPFAEYPPQIAARWLQGAVEAAFRGWPAPVRDSVAVNAIIAESANPRTAAELARQAVEHGGCRTVKVKVGADVAHDEARLRAIRSAVGAAAIRLDVNAGWSLAQAVEALPRLRDAAGGVEYVEQPVADLTDTARLRAAVGIPIAVDESLRLAPDPFDPDLHAAIREAADAVILKVPSLGGVVSCIVLSQLVGLPAVASSAMDTSIGLAAGVALARALPGEPRDCGLGTGALLRDDLVGQPTIPRSGRLGDVPSEPDPERLAAAGERLPLAERRRLLDRLAAAYDALAAPDEPPTGGAR